jgi:hypothetical protein
VRLVPDQGWGSLPDELAADVRRMSDRLGGLSESRLHGPVPPHASRADAARTAARALAVAGQGLEERDATAEPAWRTLPRLADHAVADQVAVAGHDLLTALAGVAQGEVAWAPGGRRTAREVVVNATETLAATRQLL